MPKLKLKKPQTIQEKKKQNRFRQKQRESYRENKGDTRKWKFGCKKPIQGYDLMIDQMNRAHNLYNDKIALEREKREKIRKAYRKLCPELAELDKKITEIEERISGLGKEIKQSRIENRKKIGATDEQNKELKTLKNERQVLQKRHAELRETVKNNEAVTTIQLEYKEKQNTLNRDSGVFWSTYQLIAEDVMKASNGFALPKFKRREPGGRISIQIQKQNKNIDQWFYIEPVNDDAWSAKHRGDRKRARKTNLWIRVGLDENRKVKWVVFPISYHRKIPDEVKVKRVTVKEYRIGTTTRYNAYFDLEFPGKATPTDVAKDGIIAIDYGWRLGEDDSLRVATYRDHNDETGELLLPGKILGGFELADGIQSIRDENFNFIKAEIKTWKKSRKSLPKWLRDELSHIHQWKSQRRLVRLIHKWRDNRCKNDEDIMNSLEEWKSRDRHLLDYQCGTRTSCAIYRREIYRIFAARMRRKYSTVILENGNRTRFNTLPTVNKPDDTRSKVRYNYRVAAIGELFKCLQESGMEVIKVNPANTSKICSSCQQKNKKLKDELYWTCEHCGEEHDRDHNATKNILTRGQEQINATKKEKTG